ncbi:hypothetical protein ACIGQE_01090 [Streptomyces sp. NPDC053429]|uniref:hypothetical protein n=1 Tax=Streptomyces sp. NPDC053429 TaxID=3365702 RepID=UPI0037CE7A29
MAVERTGAAGHPPKRVGSSSTAAVVAVVGVEAVVAVVAVDAAVEVAAVEAAVRDVRTVRRCPYEICVQLRYGCR